jgi:hypothetical protein
VGSASPRLYYLADAKGLLDAGADFIAHSVRDQDVDDAFVFALKASGRCYAHADA